MTNAAYWQKRMMLLEEATHRDAEACARSVMTSFARARIRINAEIEKWIMRIAINNELSMAEAKRMLKGDELDDFKMTLEEYIALGRDNGPDLKWEKRLENASAKAHITKWEAMNLSIEHYLRQAFGKEDELLEKLLEMTATERYTRAAYEIENGFGFGRIINLPVADMIVKNPWATDERIFSDRIWTNMAQMKAELQDALLQEVISGRNVDEAIERMTTYVSKEVDVAKRRASTLVMTESAAIANRAQMKAYEDLDVEDLEIVATLDSKTCDTCGDKDGLIIPASAVRMGANVPPFHANCRCCTAPVVDGYEPSERMMRDPATGKSTYIPHMTYAEWKKKYLKASE